jgi:phosphoenolpyruvate carboxykinase (ATP)
MATDFSLKQHKIVVKDIIRNAVPAVLYQEALEYEEEAAIADSGALMVRSGEKTGRSPGDKMATSAPVRSTPSVRRSRPRRMEVS